MCQQHLEMGKTEEKTQIFMNMDNLFTGHFLSLVL